MFLLIIEIIKHNGFSAIWYVVISRLSNKWKQNLVNEGTDNKQYCDIVSYTFTWQYIKVDLNINGIYTVVKIQNKLF